MASTKQVWNVLIGDVESYGKDLYHAVMADGFYIDAHGTLIFYNYVPDRKDLSIVQNPVQAFAPNTWVRVTPHS